MPLHIDILTLFPRMLDGFLAESILGNGIEAINPRGLGFHSPLQKQSGFL